MGYLTEEVYNNTLSADLAYASFASPQQSVAQIKRVLREQAPTINAYYSALYDGEPFFEVFPAITTSFNLSGSSKLVIDRNNFEVHTGYTFSNGHPLSADQSRSFIKLNPEFIELRTKNIITGLGNGTYPNPPAAGIGQGAQLTFKGAANTDFRINATDGNGRVNLYWNAYRDASGSTLRRQTANESCVRYLLFAGNTPHDPGHRWFAAPREPGGAAGDPITWTQLGQLALSSDIWFSSRGNSTDFVITSGGNVGIGTASPNLSAVLDLTSTTRGFLPPRMTSTQRNAITAPPAGLMIYNTTTNKLNFHNGSAWREINDSAV